jgi:hypothetical protein
MMRQAQIMLKNRPAAIGTKLAMDMGLSEEMVTFLRLRDTLKPPDKNLILSKNEIAELKDFNIDFTSSILTMKMAMIKLGVVIASVMKPVFMMFNRIMLATSDFTKWLAGMGKWKGVILGIAASIAIAVTAFFFPVIGTVAMIGILIAGVLLAIDDVATFMRGGDSLTGRVIKGWRQGLSDFWDWIKTEWPALMDWMGKYAVDLGKWFYNLFADIFNWISDNWKYVIGYLGEELGNFWDWAKDKLGMGDKGTNPAIEPIKPTFAIPVGAGGGANSVNQNVTINVNGARDATSVGKEVSNHLQKQTNHALMQFPRGE